MDGQYGLERAQWRQDLIDGDPPKFGRNARPVHNGAVDFPCENIAGYFREP